MGIENGVARPRNCYEYGSKVVTDGRNARELCSCLDRWLAGNDNYLVRMVHQFDDSEQFLGALEDLLRVGLILAQVRLRIVDLTEPALC